MRNVIFSLCLVFSLLTKQVCADEITFPGPIWQTKTPEEVGLDSDQLHNFRNAVGGNVKGDIGCIVRYESNAAFTAPDDTTSEQVKINAPVRYAGGNKKIHTNWKGEVSPILTVKGNRFLLDQKPFEMWGIRTASATRDLVMTDHLIRQLDDYKAHGVNTITVFYMGSSGANYDPFSSDGKRLDNGHHERMRQIIDACAARNMIVIVGIFYQHAPFGLQNSEAVRHAVRTVTRRLRDYKNIILNIANEQNSYGWKDSSKIFNFQDPVQIIDLCRIVHQEDPDRLVGGGGYDHDKNEIIGVSSHVDLLLFDTVGGQDSGLLYDRFVEAGINNKPIVNVELFGSWSKNWLKGVFSDSKKEEYFDEVDAAFARSGLSVFFHSTDWCQKNALRYDLGGHGTIWDPGIKWYFDYVQSRLLSRNQVAQQNPIIMGSIFCALVYS